MALRRKNVSADNSNPTPQSGNGVPAPTPPTDAQLNFWKRYNQTITRIIIVAVIVGGAAIYSKTQEKKTESPLQQAAEQNQNVAPANATGDINVTDKQQDNVKVKVEEKKNDQTIKTQSENITVTAQRGNGYTHLARKALAEYLKTQGDDKITQEHKIFIEDYLQKKISPQKSLHTGDEASFNTDDIAGAVGAAMQLTPNQLRNLHKYVLLVPNL